MPITEIAAFEFISPHSLSHPSVAELFRTLSVQQAAWSGYPLLYFANADSTRSAEFYLISGWENEEAHYKWIASEENQKLLAATRGLLNIRYMVHLEINFNDIPRDATKLFVEIYEGSAAVKSQIEGLAGWEVAGRDLKEGVDMLYSISDRLSTDTDSLRTAKEKFTLDRTQVE
ncbi:hypothetical protein BJ138DRAFT_1059582 [Hygrophoropsis aurantiaca]|uniref:Uncharacterized protein n=1 Tax=Hygrophoropsis aurantiaca TaxID=72124 RepID=A0ACB8AIR2_9AGAM|nr:hypothetical protein BJ138DRAFT_1059582 [Hygrophoropsis aurantiaca]